jgi:Ca2+-transporting ATPase
MEPGEKDLMLLPPRRPRARMLGAGSLAAIGLLGALVGAGCLWLFHHDQGLGVERARTLAFTGIIVLEKFNVFNFRSLRAPLHRLGYLRNPYLIGAWLLAVLLQVAAVHWPLLQAALGTVPLSLADWALVFAVGTPMLVIGEAWKIGLAARRSVRTSGCGEP